MKYFEMGGYNLDGSWGFDEERRDWDIPIHQLLVAHDATIWFHGHDHLYVQQELTVSSTKKPSPCYSWAN